MILNVVVYKNNEAINMNYEKKVEHFQGGG